MNQAQLLFLVRPNGHKWKIIYTLVWLNEEGEMQFSSLVDMDICFCDSLKAAMNIQDAMNSRFT